MSREPTVVRPLVQPDPKDQAELEERMRNVQPPPDAILHRDVKQERIADDPPRPRPLPNLLRRQAD